jgi:hypothetical protein
VVRSANVRASWYESSPSDGVRNDFFLQVNEAPSGQASTYVGAVYAMRYRLCSGWHSCTLRSTAEEQAAEIAHVDAWLHRRWYETAPMRREFRRLHPECAGYSWTRIRNLAGLTARCGVAVCDPRIDSASVRRRLMEQRALGRWIAHASPPCPEGSGLLFSDGGRMMRGSMRPRQAAAWWGVLRSAVGDGLLSPGVALRLPPATRRDPSGVVDAPFRCDNDSSPRRICDRRESATWASDRG